MSGNARMESSERKDMPDISEGQNFRFIKLGQGGEWEKECIEGGTIRLGFVEADHERCLSGDWNGIASYYRGAEKKTKTVATQFAEQIRKFYEEPEDTIWFTFYSGYLWWCKANPKVELLADGTKIRRAFGNWHNQDLNGKEITLEALSGKLLRTRGYRQTICNCKQDAATYLRHRLRGERTPEVALAIRVKEDLADAIVAVIQSLTFQDFELLIDLIFRQGGWQRSGIIGGTEKDIDLLLTSPVTKERIAIQVKSESSASELRKYIERFSSMSDFSRFFYVVHSKKEDLESITVPPNVTVISGQELGDLVVRSGLVDWVIKKAG